jgi:hypothetical protein
MKPLTHAMRGAVTDLLRTAPLSPGKVEFAWRVAVGPALEKTTFVRLEGTRLLVDAASAQWAREITRSSGTILTRLQSLLGQDTITEISIRGR